MRKFSIAMLGPFLIAVYPFLFLYSINFYKVAPQDVIRGVMVMLLITLVLVIGARLILKDLQRGLFLTSLFLIVFLFHQRFMEFISDLLFDYPSQRVIIVWAVILIAALVYSFRKPAHLQPINRFIGIFGSIVVTLSLATILFNVVNYLSQNADASTFVPQPDIEVQPPEVLPDVYYIILDGYGGQSSLVDNHGFDNSQFLDSLRDRGFYLPVDAHSNYYRTLFSLPSSLNMMYMDHLYGHRNDDPTPAIEIGQNSLVVRTMKRLGYQYIHFASRFAMNRSNPYADLLYTGYENTRYLGPIPIYPEQYLLNDYFLEIFNGSMLGLPIRQFDSRTRNPANLATLEQIATMPEATFTFAHLIIPHSPFVFDRNDGPQNPNGRNVDGEIIDQAKYETYDYYIEQLVFVNRSISQVIDTILSQSETPPIIIIQGDHGFRRACVGCPNGQDNWTDEQFGKALLSILNAYYLPNGGDALLYPEISPANSFRVVFNYYFGADLEMLEDRYFRPESYADAMYNFIEITDAVQASIAHVKANS